MKMVSERMTQGGQFLLRTLLVFLLALGFISGASAQDTDSDTDTGTIKGTVTSTKGGPIAGARVLVTDRTTGKTVALRTDAAGAFASGNLSATDFNVRVETRGFITSSALVTVKAGAVSAADFTLSPEPLPGVVAYDALENYPTQSPNFLDLLQLEPGVQNQNVGKIAPNKNGYSLINGFGSNLPIDADGLSVTDRVGGGVVQNLPASSVQQFEFGGLLASITSQFYAPGALNIVTRTGGNELHGSLFGSYGNGDILSASLPGGHSHHWGRQQYGGKLGGALIPGKVFFFGEIQRDRQDFQNPVLPGGPFALLNPASTTIPEPFRGVLGTGRLDYRGSDRVRAFYRFSYDHNSVTAPFSSGPSLQSFLARSNTPSHTAGLDFTSENFVQSVRFGYSRFKNTTADVIPPGVTSVLPYDFNIGGGSISSCPNGALICVGSSPFSNQQNFQSDVQARYDASHISGKHQWHFGGSYDRISVGRFAPLYSAAPALSDQSSVPLAAGLGGSSGRATDPSAYPVQWAYLSNGRGVQSEKSGFGLPGGGLTDHQLSAYGADTWKITPNLSVSYGVHWTRETAPNNSDLGPIPQLNALQSKLGNRVRQPNYNFAPQLGVAWDTSSNGTTTIRAGIGMFYDQSSFLNAYSDRVLRLQQGTYFATVPACIGGASGNIPWPVAAGAPGTIINGSGIVNANGTVSPFDAASGVSWCGESMGAAAPRALSLQQAYQSAFSSLTSNGNYMGNAGAFASPMLNGLSLMSPNYQTPRTVRANVGLRHELRPGLVFTADYVREVTTRTLLGIDANQGGAVGTFSLANALAARDSAQTSNGCATGTNQVGCMVAKLGPAGALAAYGASGIGGPAQVTSGSPCPFCAFPGIRPNVGVTVMDIPEGRSVYSGTLLSLNQEIKNFGAGVQRATFRVSYAHSRNVSQGQDESLAMLATDYANPTRFTGPSGLDRTHQISMAAFFDLRHSVQLSFLSHFASPLPVTLRFQQNAGGAEVLVTDWNGDGSTGDLVLGSNVGSFMRSISASGLQKFIASYNLSDATSSTPQTPAGNALINAGVFSLPELQSMGGVLQPLAVATQHVAGLGWYKTLDLRLGWEHHLGERITLAPSISFYNLFNFANFDLPGYTQSGFLNFGAGSLSPGGTAVQPQNTVGGNASGANGRMNRATLGPNMNATGAPRSLEWGLKLSF